MNQKKPSSNLVGRRRATKLAAISVTTLIGACQIPGGGEPPRRIRLEPISAFPPNLPSVGWTLLVQEPDATLAINTARIAYVRENGDIQYLATGEWASRAPEMVMELVVESFQDSGRMLSVGDRRARIRPDFELETRLTAFQVEETGRNSGVVQVALEGSLIRRPERIAVSSFGYDSQSTVEQLSFEDITSGFQAGLNSVIEQTVEWTLKTGAAV